MRGECPPSDCQASRSISRRGLRVVNPLASPGSGILTFWNDQTVTPGDGTNVHESKNSVRFEQFHPGFISLSASLEKRSPGWARFLVILTKGSRLGNRFIISDRPQLGPLKVTLDDLAEDAAVIMSDALPLCLEHAMTHEAREFILPVQ